MKQFAAKMAFVTIFLHLLILSHFAAAQEKDGKNREYRIIERDLKSGAYRIKSQYQSPQSSSKLQLHDKQSLLDKELAVQKHLTAQHEEMRKLYEAYEKGRKENQRKVTVQLPKLNKIKLFGKTTPFYEAPYIPQQLSSQRSMNVLTSNVLINGKTSDSIFTGDAFEMTFSFAPNTVSALVNVYADMNMNGTIDSGDFALISNGIAMDNGDVDINPAAEEFKVVFPQGDWFTNIITPMIFEVNNFQSSSTALLTIKQKPSSKVIVGTVTPTIKGTYVSLSSYIPDNQWFRTLFPDSSGAITVQFDTSASTQVGVIVGNIEKTPADYFPPPDTMITIKKDTTLFIRQYHQAKEFIEGYVKDQNGNPVDNAAMRAYQNCWECDYYSSVQINTTTDSTGYYKVGALAGEWNVSFYPPSTSDDYVENFNRSRYISVGLNQTVKQDFTFLHANSSISGNVKYGVNGVGGVFISAFADTLFNFGLSMPDGGYSTKVFKPDAGEMQYGVNAVVDDYGYFIDSAYRSNISPGATNVNFSIIKVTGGVYGIVKDITTGKPIKNANINFYGPSSRYAMSNDTGYFKISLPDGEYSISVYAQYYEYYSNPNPITIPGAFVPLTITMTRTGSFSGTVVDEMGMPIPNAEITARDSFGGYYGYGSTNFKGEYVVSMSYLYQQQYIAVAQASGFVQQWYDKKSTMDSATTFKVTKGYDTPNINFVLSKGGSISGSVKNKNGVGIPNVFVSVGDTLLRLVSMSPTDDSGKYVVSGLTTGKYYAVAHGEEYVEEWYNGASNYHDAEKIPVVINQNTPDIDFTLHKGGMITGIVTDKMSNPLLQAEVAIVDSSYNYIRYDMTDNSGVYEIKRIRPGEKIYIAASKYGYSRRWYNNVSAQELATPIILTDEETKNNIDFTLPNAAKITGSVKDKLGNTIQYVNIFAVRTEGFDTYFGNSDNFGNYSISNINPGKYKISASHFEYLPQWYDHKPSVELADSVLVHEEETLFNIDFNLIMGGKITGVVKNTSGNPVEYPVVIATQANTINTYYGNGDQFGNYSIINVSPGKYTVSASHYMYNQQWYDHKPSLFLADTITVEVEKTISNINFNLKPLSNDTVVVKIVVDDLPATLKFSQSHVSDYAVDYWWGIRFEAFNDSTLNNGDKDFETEIALLHAKMPGESEFTADPISVSQRSVINWIGNTGYHVHSNVNVFRDPNNKNTLFLTAPKSWFEIQRIDATTKFYANTLHYGLNGQVRDTTSIGTGETTIIDSKGDIPFGFVDLVSSGWKAIILSVDKFAEVPQHYSLEQNYPNPFNPVTTIRYALPASAQVKLVIHDILGREVATLVNGVQTVGWKEVKWNATNVASGIYFYRIQSGEFVETKKMVLMR